jgi:hypothetical protein
MIWSFDKIGHSIKPSSINSDSISWNSIKRGYTV